MQLFDIIQEGAHGRYDAMVLGRRGFSWLEQAYDESVTKGVFRQTVNFLLWICRRPDLERKNLLAVAKKVKIADKSPEEILKKVESCCLQAALQRMGQ